MKKQIILLLAASLIVAGCASKPVADHHHLPTMAATPAADLLIISATFGSGTNFADVTCRVNDLLRQPDAEFFARPEWLSADPAPGWNKTLVIVYEVSGHRHIFACGEGGKVSASVLLNE
ncbi:MAG TPA: hypothetical protein VG347_07940 [Verrucomicrobiae bacterium]|nr:hypothetical protein [Verrucomicrobiae bacterium]